MDMLCQPTPIDSEEAKKVADEVITAIQKHLQKMKYLQRFEDIPGILIRATSQVVSEDDRKTVAVSTFFNKITRYAILDLKIEKKKERELKEVMDEQLRKIYVNPEKKVEIGMGKTVAKTVSEATTKWIMSMSCIDPAFRDIRIVEHLPRFYAVVLQVLDDLSKASAAHQDDELEDLFSNFQSKP